MPTDRLTALCKRVRSQTAHTLTQRAGAWRTAVLSAALVASTAVAPAFATTVPDDTDCIAEQEPNDQPDVAMPAAGDTCIAAEFGEGDQDIYVWTVSADDAAHRWTIEVSGIPETMVQFKLMTIVLDSAGTLLSSAELLAAGNVGVGEPAVVSDVLLPAGTYYIGASATARGSYQLTLTSGEELPPSGDAEPNDEQGTATPLSSAFSLSGTLDGADDWYAWTLSDADAATRWQLSLQAPIGSDSRLAILDATGNQLIDVPVDASGQLVVDDLGLAAGDYFLRVVPALDAGLPYVLAAAPGDERDTNLEEEPNDDVATAYRIDRLHPVDGRLTRANAADHYRFTVDAALADTQFDVKLFSQSPAARKLCLLDAAGEELLCRDGTGGLVMANLLLSAGDYVLRVSGEPDADESYLIRIDATSPPAGDFEAEPNDGVAQASPIGDGFESRGRLTGTDADYFHVSVDGEPELWRVEVEGQGVARLAVVDGAGREQMSATAPGEGVPLVLTDVFLLPGDHWLAVSGEDGDYTLRAEPIGPPDPLGEREPNDDVGRAERLAMGVTRTGRLPDLGDRDVYRFSLAAEEHVALVVEPPDDGAVAFRLEWGGGQLTEQPAVVPGEPVVYDAVLPPGDYVLTLSAATVSEGEYAMTLERRDPFDPPVDREPNDTAAQAAPLPGDLIAVGSIVDFNDADWYAVPRQPAPSTVTIAVDGDITPSLWDGESEVVLVPDDGGASYQGTAPGDVPLQLRVEGAGEYELEVTFDGSRPEPPVADLPVELSASIDGDTVAAHWPEGQRVTGTVTLNNTGDEPLQLAIDATTSDARWDVTVSEPDVSVDAGAIVDVAFDVAVPADAWVGDVRISFRTQPSDNAENCDFHRQIRSDLTAFACGNVSSGARVTGGVDVVADRDADPVDPAPSWTLPDELLGGVNVAAVALGAEPLTASDGQPPESTAALFDGLVLPGLGFSTDTSLGPTTVDVRLAGDTEIAVAGVVLHPEPLGVGGTHLATNQARSFEVQLSSDGTTYETALAGELDPAAAEQAFVFDTPVEARFARLVLANSHGGSGDVRLAELAVIATPGLVPAGFEPVNVADPSLGGHVVRATPAFFDPAAAADMLREDGAPAWFTAQPDAGAEWVVGFAANRAAQISELRWIDAADSDPAAQLTTVEVAVSIVSPSGPWEPLGTWERDRSGGDPTMTLDDTVWARFVRFTVAPEAEPINHEYPATVRVLEAPSDDTYRTIVAEWGADNATAIYEQLNPPPTIVADAAGDPGDEPDAATALTPGVAQPGRVHVDVDVDWYRVDVPDGQNTLRLVVEGNPTVSVDVAVETTDGVPLPVAVSGGADVAEFTATVEPGTTYLVRVEQPVPSVVFAYDTSISLAPFVPAIDAALNHFASGVVPGRESVQIVPFGDPPLLDAWTDEPYVLQGAIRNNAPVALSSDSPEAIATATRLLAGQPGTNAIVLLTDAETTLTNADAMWEGLDGVRPRVFAVHIGANNTGFPVSQAMMEDWASVNAGFYAYAASQGDIDVAFERAATVLRRPAAYVVTAETDLVAPPEPETTVATTPPETSAPAAPETAAPTAPEAPGSIAVVAPPAADGQPPATASSSVAVELILDTSGSMRQSIGGSTRADVAKQALIDLVTVTLPPGTPVALRVFGSEPDSCDTQLAVPLGPLDPAAMAGVISDVPVVDLVRTPLASSLEQVASDLAGIDGPKIVVLVTDGEETCDGDPEAAIRSLVDQGVDVHVNIVGFALDDEALAAQFAEWASIGQGQYFDAGDASQLGPAVAAAVQAPFQVIDADGNVVASGVLGGPAVTVAAGTYTVEVLTEPPQRFDDVAVGDGETVTLTLD